MNNTFGFESATRGLSRASTIIERASESALDDCALLTVRTAVEGIESEASWLKQQWPRGGKLKPATIRARRRKGMIAKADRPLHETGTMVLGISFEQSPGQRIVGTHPGYAEYVEKGEWSFLRPSLQKAAPDFPMLFSAEIRKGLQRLKG